ncbi:MAG TPA: 6-carboxytetrahydropterin synthase, partial [Phycisphaerales bacterium]|nr:6-carboxytetrahydropterin synthase [Phycisphaerales bacterium]
VIRAFLPALGAALERLGGRLGAVVWRLSPYYRLEMETTAPDRALIRQQFELAASHRLHVPTLSAEQNRTLFGKCNNPKGHGHNYRVEPCVEVPVGEGTAAGFGLADLERITQRVLISRFDHTHLNEDMPEFSSRTGVNPSVENIAQVFFRLLAPAIKAEAGQAATLRSLTVWETDKTAATYPA